MNKELGLLSKRFFLLFSFVLFLTLGLAIWTEKYLLLLIPASIIGILALYLDYTLAFKALLFSVPISLHLKFGSLALDVASEPLMIILLGISPFIFLNNPKEFRFIFHTIILLILFQLLWAIITSITSINPVLSIKYILSKLWFIVPFLLLGIYFIKRPENLVYVFWLIFSSLLITIVYTTIRHAQNGFTFATSNFVMNPFFHNHVDYSTMIAVFLPFVWYARYWYPNYSYRRSFINVGFILFLIAIVASYTRASILATALLIPAFLIIKWNKTKLSLGIASLGVIVAAFYLFTNNKYLDYGIEYNKVVSHNKNFNNLMKATYNMEDVSGMERVYRWVAAQNLIRENYLLGTGPNTFNPEYKKYAVVSFETYVSDNPEQSTTHNYFLLLFCEQGIMGFLLFTVLYFMLLIKGTALAKKFKDQLINNISIATTLSLMMLLLHLLLNDMIETDKLGSLFYISCALIVRLDMWSSEETFYSKEQER